MLALSKDHELNSHCQRAGELLRAEATVAGFSNGVGLTLFYDSKLVLAG